MLLVICHQKEDRVEGGIFIYLFIYLLLLYHQFLKC